MNVLQENNFQLSRENSSSEGCFRREHKHLIANGERVKESMGC